MIVTFGDNHNFVSRVVSGSAETGFALESALAAIESEERNNSHLVYTVLLLLASGDSQYDTTSAARAVMGNCYYTFIHKLLWLETAKELFGLRVKVPPEPPVCHIR